MVLLGTAHLTLAEEPKTPGWEPQKGVSVASADGLYSFRLQGRVHFDYVNANLEDENQINAAEVRRAWLDVSGTARDWYFLHRFDVHEQDQKLESFLEYRGFGEMAWLSFGRNKEPFGMAWVSSSNHSSTPERSPVSQRFTFGWNTGLMLRGYTPQVGYQLGVFEGGDPADEQRARQLAFSGRLFAPLLNTSFHTLHLGGAYSERPDQSAYGLELAYLSGSLHVQSEAMISRPDLGDDLSGYYLELGWFFTPDHLIYDKGVFTNNISPSRDYGAWQAIVRWEDGDGDFSDIQLGEGEGRALVLGLNWFAQTNIRFAASYSFGELKEPAADEKGDELRLRAQFVF